MLADLAMLLQGAGGMAPQPVTGSAIGNGPLVDPGQAHATPPPAPVKSKADLEAEAAKAPATDVDDVTVTAQRTPPNYDNTSAVSAAHSALGKANAAAAQSPSGYAQGGGDNPGVFGLLPQGMQHGTLRNVLGALGDAFLVGSGRQAEYEPRMQRQQIGNAMAGLDPSDPKSVLAAATRIAATGAPGAEAQAGQIFEQAGNLQMRRQIAEQNNQYRQSQIQARNDQAVQRMVPYIGGMAQQAKTPEDYKRIHDQAESIAQRIGPEYHASDFGLPETDQWQPGMTSTTGATTGQVMRENTSTASIAERRDAAAQASADRNRGQNMTAASSKYSTDHRTSAQARLPTAGSIDNQIIQKLNAGQPLLPGEQQYWQHRMNGGKATRSIPASLQVNGGGQAGGQGQQSQASGPVVTNGDVRYVKAHPEMKQQFESHFGKGSYAKYVGG